MYIATYYQIKTSKMAQNAISDDLKFKNFLGGHAPRPPSSCLRQLLDSYTKLPVSRLTIVSREAKKKLAVRNERVSYLHVAPL